MGRKRMMGVLTAFLLVAAQLAGCGAAAPASGVDAGQSAAITVDSSTSSSDTVVQTSAALVESGNFTERDMEVGYDEGDCVIITLADGGSTASGSGVNISGDTVTITAEGSYIVRGSLSQGQLVVETPKTAKLQVIFDGVSIANNSTAPLYVKQTDKVFVTIANGSQNSLAVGGDFVAIDDNNIDAVIFSKDDITLNGSGELTLTSTAGNGITSKDDLVITGGSYSVEVGGHGLEGKDSVRISDGSFKLTTGKDAIHSENSDDTSLGTIYIAGGSFEVNAQGDGLDGAAAVQIDGGSFNLATGGGSSNASTDNTGAASGRWGSWGVAMTSSAENQTSAKGIKADGVITINAGVFDIDSSDDSIHANNDVAINGGTFKITSGDDGIHADSNVTVSDGAITISKSYEGIEGQSVEIKGGDISIVASDDGLNAAGGNDGSALGGRPGQGNFASSESADITISGGKLIVDAGGDGIDSNGTLTVTGGETYVWGPTNSGNGALDYDRSGTITGGIFVAVGASGMAQNFGSESTQPSALINLQGNQSGELVLVDSSGNELLRCSPTKQYGSALISLPQMQQDGSYTLQAGSAGQSFTMSGIIYGASGGMGGMGGRGEMGGGRGGMAGMGGNPPADGGTPPEMPEGGRGGMRGTQQPTA